MPNPISHETRRRWAPVAVCLLMILALLALPTGYEDAQLYQEAERCSARVLEVDNSTILDTGLVRSGEQRCTVELLNGAFQGRTVTAVNLLNGSLEQDKLFAVGDRALVVVSHDGGEITNVTMSDHDRLGWEAVMAALFAVFLLLFAGPGGLRAILSFVVTVLAIWKVLIPLYLRGADPVWLGLALTLGLTVLIIALVYGFDRRCAAAVSGSFLGISVTPALGLFFTRKLQNKWAVMSYSESLLYSGYQHLDLTRIFMASIFLGASGAVMDLSVDITSAVWEVVQKRPDLRWREVMASGFTVGRAAMGTMTTTLLFAYSGGYVALLMVFMAQGTPISHILNYKYVAAELVHTILGSFGLVSVAPFTAFCAAVLSTRRRSQGRQGQSLEPGLE